MSASLLTNLVVAFGYLQASPGLISPSASPSRLPAGSAAATSLSSTTLSPAPAVAALPPVSPRELHSRVAPAVVALVVSGTASTPPIVSGVLVTASGLVLTSRRAIADAIDGRAALAMLRAGSRGRLSPRELAAAVPARLIAVSDELDLALVQAEPTESVFYPHLPIARQPSGDGSGALALGHAEKQGLWSATMLPVGRIAGPGTPERWMRQLPAESAAIGAGTPLVDALGRIVGMVIAPTRGEGRLAVDAEGLLRFLLAANAPELRFAGVPPFRRPLPTEGLGAARGLRGAPGSTANAGASSAPADESLMPSIVKKGQLDRRFSNPEVAGGLAGGARLTVGAGVPDQGRRGPRLRDAVPITSFDDAQNGVSVTLAELERHPVPSSVAVGTNDVPERGARTAAVTIVQLGDFHAPETREAEGEVRSLVEGPAAVARLLWKDADRGDGADYHLAARAARAAAEQDAFWPMHDRLLATRGATPLELNQVHRLARDLGLDAQEFAAAISSDGLTSAVETDAARAGALPLLCTPAFVVNGRAVDGGSIAALALRAAVDEELTHPPQRTISAGAPVAGSSFDGAKMARAVAEAIARRTSSAKGR